MTLPCAQITPFSPQTPAASHERLSQTVASAAIAITQETVRPLDPARMPHFDLHSVVADERCNASSTIYADVPHMGTK